jgi:hypothetical protein
MMQSQRKMLRDVSVEPLVLLLFWLTVGQILVGLFLVRGLDISGFAAIPYLNVSSFSLSFLIFCYIVGRAPIAGRAISVNGVKIWLFALLAIMLVGLGIGLIQQNSTAYIFSDTLYFANWIIGTLAATLTFADAPPDKIERFGRLTGAVMLLAFVAALMGKLLLNYDISPTILRFAQCYLVLCIFQRSPRHKYVIIGAMTVILLGVFDTNRATLIMLFAIIVFASWLARKAEIAVALVLGILFGGPWLLTVAIQVVPENTVLGRRLVESEYFVQGRETIENSLASLQRVYENEIVKNKFANDDWIFIIPGFGSGATISARAIPGVEVYSGSLLGLDTLHNIHFLTTALFFRHGLLGLCFLAVTLLQLISAGLRLRNMSRSQPRFLLGASAVLYCVATLAYAAPASNFFFADPLFGFVIALALTLSVPNRLARRFSHFHTLGRRPQIDR